MRDIEFNGDAFGERLRLAMAKRNLTRRDLERASGISRQAVYLWEQKKFEPRLSTMVAIAAALDVPLQWLIDPNPVELW